MKKYIVGILIGILLSSTVIYAASYLYHADEVSFTPNNSNWNVDSVDKALNDLYDKANNSGAVYLGEFSTTTTIDVSRFGATSVGQFVIATHPSRSFNNANEERMLDIVYNQGSLSLNQNRLTITPASVSATQYSKWANDPRAMSYASTSGVIPTRVYYVGNIKTNN